MYYNCLITPQEEKLIDFKVTEEKYPSHFEDSNTVEISMELRPNIDYCWFLTSVTIEAKGFLHKNTFFAKYQSDYILDFGKPFKIDKNDDNFLKILPNVFKDTLTGFINKYNGVKTDTVFKDYVIAPKTDSELLSFAKRIKEY